MMGEAAEQAEGVGGEQGYPEVQGRQMNGLESLAIRIRDSCQQLIQDCYTKAELAQQIIDVGLTTPQQETIAESSAIHGCNRFICSDTEEMVQIFINTNQSIQQRGKEDEDLQVLTEEVFQESELAFTRKYENLIYVLKVAVRKHNNDTALGYISKILLNIVNVNPSGLYSFFNRQNHYVEDLISTCEGSLSMAEFVANMLGQQYETKQFYQLKHYILNQMLQKLRQSVRDQDMFSNLLYFVECMLNKNKYQSEETELGKLCQLVVAKAEVEFYLKQMINSFNHETVFTNCVGYMKVVVDRMVGDEQVDPYYRNTQEGSLKFHTTALYTNIGILLTLQLPPSYSGQTKLQYYQFLYTVTRHSGWKHIPYLAVRCVIVLFRMFRAVPILAKYYVHQIMIETIYKVNRWNTKNIMLVVSVIDPDQKAWPTEQLPYLYKTMIVLLQQNKEFSKHFSAWPVDKILKKYKRVLASNPTCKYFKELQFLKPYQFQFDSPPSPRKNSIKQCSKVVQLSNNLQHKIEPVQGLFSDFCGGIKEISSEEEDEEYIYDDIPEQKVSWRENPQLYFYVSHLYIF